MGSPALTTPSVSYRLTHLALYAHEKNHRTVTSPWLRPSGTTMCRRRRPRHQAKPALGPGPCAPGPSLTLQASAGA